MSPNGMTNGRTHTAILAVIGVVAVSSIFCTAFSPDNAGSILSICTMICVSLLAILQQGKIVQKQDETLAKQEVQIQHGVQTFAELKEVHKAANSLTERLEKRSEEAGVQIGTEEERLRAEAARLATAKVELEKAAAMRQGADEERARAGVLRAAAEKVEVQTKEAARQGAEAERASVAQMHVVAEKVEVNLDPTIVKEGVEEAVKEIKEKG